MSIARMVTLVVAATLQACWMSAIAGERIPAGYRHARRRPHRRRRCALLRHRFGWHRPLLGREWFRPARRRDHDRPAHRGARSEPHPGDGHRGRRQPHLRDPCRRHGALLGIQLERPDRARHAEPHHTAPGCRPRGHDRDHRRSATYLRAGRQGCRPLLGRQRAGAARASRPGHRRRGPRRCRGHRRGRRAYLRRRRSRRRVLLGTQHRQPARRRRR